MPGRRSLLSPLMLATGLCPALAWQQGVAWVAEVGDPMIHCACQGLAAWPTLRGNPAGPFVYLLLLPFAALDLAFAIGGETNVPWTQVCYVPLLAATTALALLGWSDGGGEPG